MAAMNRSNIARQLVPGLNAVVGLTYGEIDNEHEALFEIENSEKAFEEEVYFSQFATAPVKQEGAAVEYDEGREEFVSRYYHNTVALAFAITEEAFEDNLYDSWSKVRAKALGRAMGNTKQTFAANVFNYGFSGGAYAGGDGVAFFSNAHPTMSGNQSNLLTGDLAESTLENGIITAQLFTDSRGILIGSQVESLHIPPQLQFVAERLTKTPGRVGTPNNDINAIKNMGLLPKGYFVNHRFTDTNGWFLRTDVVNGAKMFVRAPLQTKMDEDFATGNMLYKARERYSFGWSDWRSYLGSQGS